MSFFTEKFTQHGVKILALTTLYSDHNFIKNYITFLSSCNFLMLFIQQLFFIGPRFADTYSFQRVMNPANILVSSSLPDYNRIVYHVLFEIFFQGWITGMLSLSNTTFRQRFVSHTQEFQYWHQLILKFTRFSIA